ncbi:MAG: aminotransferase class I/II-fold pyridoxal phosphate-dependent enzyme [Bacillota bacterium]|nr:aminotransferase class I/II-fold pyridoxal phosphate-dependent enzyme [Bacillota bacterium]
MCDKNLKSIFPDLRHDAVSFHMPGHKGRLIFSDVPNDFLRYDLTELPGMDNLIQPESWIKMLTNRISEFYGSAASRILVGGSTAGILAAILGTARLYAKPIRAVVNRNAHISVYNAVEIAGIHAKYVTPAETNGVFSHFDLSALLHEIEEADMLVLTYPFYQGALYEIGRIIAEAKRRNPEIVIIVDEAHGAHLVLAEKLHNRRISSLSWGADIVIQSFHKTLPALGQTAVLHYGNTEKGHALASRGTEIHSVEWYMKALQTTSPSYLMLKSVSQMMDLLEREGTTLYRNLLDNIRCFYEETGLSPFSYEGKAVQDESKILLPFASQDAFIARGIYPEMELDGRVLFLSSIANSKQDFERLSEAVQFLGGREMSEGANSADNDKLSAAMSVPISAAMPVSIPAAMPEEKPTRADLESRLLRYGSVNKTVPLRSSNAGIEKLDAEDGFIGDEHVRVVEVSAIDAVGMVSAETLVLYPPGSPLILKGEVFQREVAPLLGEIKVKIQAI